MSMLLLNCVLLYCHTPNLILKKKHTKNVTYFFCTPVRRLAINCVNETKIYHYDVQMCMTDFPCIPSDPLGVDVCCRT